MKVVLSIDVMAVENLTYVKPELLKALDPSDVTEFGMEIKVRLLQFMKASFPMELTVSGMITEVKLRQLLKALSLMALT
jgi:hypothetical protein